MTRGWPSLLTGPTISIEQTFRSANSTRQRLPGGDPVQATAQVSTHQESPYYHLLFGVGDLNILGDAETKTIKFGRSYISKTLEPGLLYVSEEFGPPCTCAPVDVARRSARRWVRPNGAGRDGEWAESESLGRELAASL